MNSQPPSNPRAEFIVVINPNATESGWDIAEAALADALEEHWEEGAASRAWQFITEQHQRVTGSFDSATGKFSGPTIYSFQIELSDEVNSPALVLTDTAESLRRHPGIAHVLKFYDSLLEAQNRELFSEILVLELRLRRAVSLIYLPAADGHYYDLLRRDVVELDKRRRPKDEEMKAAAENEFFYLLFGAYGKLNQLRPTRGIGELVELLMGSGDFETLRRQLTETPISDADDRAFLDRIKKSLDPVETLRNCIAHNRVPTEDELNNYRTAKAVLDTALKEFFDRFTIIPADDGEMHWDTAAREAVEHALENADWDEEAKTITLYDPDEPRMNETVTSREELANYLRSAARDAFYANCSRDDGEYISECDEDGIVENVLADYEERLETFFAKEEENEAET